MNRLNQADIKTRIHRHVQQVVIVCLAGFLMPSRVYSAEITELVAFGASQATRSATNGPTYVDYLADDLGVPIKNFATTDGQTAAAHKGQIDRYLRDNVPTAGTLFVSSHWGWAGDIVFGRSPDQAAEGAFNNIETLVESGGSQFLLSTETVLPILAPGLRDTPDAESLHSDVVASQQLVHADVEILESMTDVTIYRTDRDLLFRQIIDDPAPFGFTNTNDPVQGTGGNPNQFLWWDDFHWTTAAHRLVADRALESIVVPEPNAQGLLLAVVCCLLFVGRRTER